MRCDPRLGVPILMLWLIMRGLPVLSQAQTGLTDFRGRSGYSAEDMAQALFPGSAPPSGTNTGYWPTAGAPVRPSSTYCSHTECLVWVELGRYSTHSTRRN